MGLEDDRRENSHGGNQDPTGSSCMVSVAWKFQTKKSQSYTGISHSGKYAADINISLLPITNQLLPFQTMPMEDDDDEFGDLYTDVLQPVAAPPLRPQLISLSNSTSTDPARDHAIDQKTGIPSSRGTPDASIHVIPPEKVRTGAEAKKPDAEEDWILGPAPIPKEKLSDWNENEENGDSKQLVADLPKKSSFGDAKEEEPAGRIEDGGLRVKEEVVDPLSSKVSTKFSADDDIGDFDVESAIPGLSAEPVVPGAFHGLNVGATEVSRSEDWDSDSGDDLQIVLNDDSLDHCGVQGNKGAGGDDEDDEDGEDDLVIVTDEDQLHHHPQGMEERERGEEPIQHAPDGEKELPDAAKGSGGVGTVSGRVGYSGHGFHPQHHSQFKYVRPGAAPGTGISASGAGGGGQIRPFTTAPVAGRGRGLLRGFHPGYGAPSWGNSSSNRLPGSGLEFTLPSHKTIFEVDIDVFEEKPWKHPGVDISDFFNFELDEESWKAYCRQLEQLCLESTMQSKIRVYESGRSEQDYDPDLPPELAAASHQDVSAENSNPRRVDGGQSELSGQGRGAAWTRPQLPMGRAIQVEMATIERLPTIDTRQARPRESDDAIIEIVLQGSLDDPEQSGNEAVVDAYVEGNEGRSPLTQDGRQEMTRKTLSVHDGVHEGVGILPCPTELSNSYSKRSSPSLSPGGRTGRSYTERQVVGAPPERYSDASDEYTNDAMSDQSAQVDRNGKRQRSDDNTVTNETSEVLPATLKESSVENRDNEHDDRLDLIDSADEREEILSDLQNSGNTLEDSNSSYSQKISSHIEQPVDLDNCDRGNSTTTPVDNTKLKPHESVKQGEGYEVETMQDPRPGMSGDLRRHRDDDKHSFQQKNDHGHASRHEIDRSLVNHKGKEALRRSHANRELDSDSVYHIPDNDIDGYEKPKERGASSGIWHKRDAEIYNRRIKEGNLPVHSEETGSRHRNKLRPIDRKSRAEDLYLKKQKEEGYWRNRHDREVGLKHREGVNVLITHRENFKDVHVNKRKNDEQHRRDRAGKEILHGHRARDDSSQSKRERADDLDHRRNDNLGRPREKAMDHLFSGHRDDNRQHREQDDRQWSKQAHEDKHGYRDRGEGESVARNSHILEQKPHVENEKAKDGAKGFAADKDSLNRKKHNEHPKRGGHVEIHLRNKVYQEIHAHEPQFSNEVKGYRNGRPSNHGNHSLQASDRPPHMNREKHRSSARRSNKPEIKQSLLPHGKRKHEDSSVHQSEKANKNIQSDESVKRINGRESSVIKNDSHVDQKQEAVQEEKIPSDAEGQGSRRGRSKLERWTSHVERDYSSTTTNHSLFSSLGNTEVNNDNIGVTRTGELLKTEVSKLVPIDPDNKESSVVQASDKEECSRHLETVAKLKKRSERFKLPMPVEDTATNKKAETEVSAIQSEPLADSEIKQERPARKRRWGGS